MFKLMTRPELRAYTYPSDTKAIERMWNETFGKTWPLAGEHIGRILAAQGRDNQGWCDVVTHGEPIGVVAYQQRRQMPKEGSIVLVLVHPAYRRKKIGTTLVQNALRKLRQSGAESVELGAWATPLFWHGVPADCSAGKKFFKALGWHYYEDSADLLLDLRNYQTPKRIYDKVAQYNLKFRLARGQDKERILEFVGQEFNGFLPFYTNELGPNGRGFISLAESGDRIDATVIFSRFPCCPGAHWYRLLGTNFGVAGAAVVRRELRRRGIGLATTAYSMEELKRLGCQSCYYHWTWMIEMYGQLGTRMWRRYTLGRLSI